MLKVLSIVMMFVMLIPTASTTSHDESDSQLMTVSVFFPEGAVAADGTPFAKLVDNVITPYDGYIMAEVNQLQKSHLEAAGAIVIIEENLHTVGIDGYNFDTRMEEPFVKDELRFRPMSGVEGKYLVQFVSRIKREWLEALNKVGLEPVSYYPYNTMLVETTPEIRATLGG
ncbi:MAG: hypothetical protein KAI64_05775, partial [Thermoplasmata archaeon]|nr:hypothetical protein [Thermoplasmata archaeon]